MTKNREKKPTIEVKKPLAVAIPRKTTPAAMLPVRPRGGVFGRPVAHATSKHKKATLTASKNDANEGEMLLFGSIGADWFGEGITAQSFNDELQNLGDVDKITLRINSGGGDVFEATAIYNMLVKHDAEVIIEIEGVAASAATLIAMAGDKVHISENAHFMIHAASGMAWGNAEEIRQYLKLLDNADGLIRLTYSARTSLSDSELLEMMSTDNWMTAQEAKDHGFVDVIDEAKRVKPHVTKASASNVAQEKVALSPERLAAFTGNLQTLAAMVRPAASLTNTTGGSPQPVTPVSKERKMNAKLRAKCVAAGMSDKLTDEQANAWFDENMDKVLTAKVEAPKTPEAVIEQTVAAAGAVNIQAELQKWENARAEKRKAWRKEVDANISLAFGDAVPAGLKEQCYDLQEEGVDSVRAKVQQAKKDADTQIADGGIRINFKPTQPRDNHIAAIRTGVMARCLSNFISAEDVKLTPSQILEKHLPEKDRPNGWSDFAQMPLSKIAEQCLLADGLTYDQINRLNVTQIAQASLGFYRQAGVRASAAIHTTGSLAEITRDAVNKSLLAGYQEAPQTWRGPGRQATSVSDFKDIHRVKLGAAANLPVWNDNTAPEKAKLSNEKEKYAVEARAETLSFSWRLIVNDDLDALSRRPQLLGDAAARTVNAVFWQQVTSNPTMADAQALFLETPAGNRKRSNYITGSATPTNSTIGSMKKLMRLMHGLNTPEGNEGDDVLNLTPSFIVGPAALEELILKQVLSGADPASGGNSAVYNTARQLTPVIEPLLDADSATAWYLFASPGRVDTVEVTFLQGQETPFAHEWMDDETMCQNYTIVQTFAAKAIDHRGIIKHKGAV